MNGIFPDPSTDGTTGASGAKCSAAHLKSLSNKALKDINKALADIDAANKACSDAEACGQDCAQFRDDNDAMRSELMAIKAHYFPNAA
jgi:hypothetical protein